MSKEKKSTSLGLPFVDLSGGLIEFNLIHYDYCIFYFFPDKCRLMDCVSHVGSVSTCYWTEVLVW